MKPFYITILVFSTLWGVATAQSKTTHAEEQMTPRIRFTGDPYAQIATAIFAETLQDMRNKIEYGDNEKYPLGFFHTSTEPKGINYYNQMWSRDCGRGVVELARLGFAYDAKIISRYFLSHITDNHWGRRISNSRTPSRGYEVDGNAWVLSGICNAWYANGKDKALGTEFCTGMKPVVGWIDSLVTVSPYKGLLPSISELSGNPSASYPVYSIFGNYGIYVVLDQIADMAKECNQTALADKAHSLHQKMEEALRELISDGRKSYAPQGCWFNGIDSRSGAAYDMSDWDGTAWPIWHWTRQLPFIQDYDFRSNRIGGKFKEVNQASYELLRKWMATGEYFRKYGFVSNSGWTGMGLRHDETMGGYGQGFFTQAALMADDVNTYTKCLEGVARLNYDGGVIEHLNYEKSPFIVNECFNYENYEKGLDHTFGTHKEGRREIMENPSDEGNLVQEAEIIKAFSLVTGVGSEGTKLVLMPRLPWLWDSMECQDFPVVDNMGKMHRIQFSIRHDRWLRRCTVELSGTEGFSEIDVRFGPFPRMIKNPKNFEIENSENCSWIWKRGLKNNTKKIVVDL